MQQVVQRRCFEVDLRMLWPALTQQVVQHRCLLWPALTQQVVQHHTAVKCTDACEVSVLLGFGSAQQLFVLTITGSVELG